MPHKRAHNSQTALKTMPKSAAVCNIKVLATYHGAGLSRRLHGDCQHAAAGLLSAAGEGHGSAGEFAEVLTLPKLHAEVVTSYRT